MGFSRVVTGNSKAYGKKWERVLFGISQKTHHLSVGDKEEDAAPTYRSKCTAYKQARKPQKKTQVQSLLPSLPDNLFTQLDILCPRSTKEWHTFAVVSCFVHWSCPNNMKQKISQCNPPPAIPPTPPFNSTSKHEIPCRDASTYFFKIASYKLMSPAMPAPVIMPA